MEKLFEGAVVGAKVARMISGRRTDYGATAAENLTALAFFLDRATRARLLLDGHRAQDVPMTTYHRAAPVVVATAAGDASAVALLLRYGVADRSVRAAVAYVRDAAADAGGRPMAARARRCLDVLLRAVVRERGAAGGPPRLQHLARCSVRAALYDNFNLPHGVPLLPVPRSLVPYLDLEC